MNTFDTSKLAKLDNPMRRNSMPPMETLKKFGIQGPATLLDIGCGIGYFTIAAAEILKNGKVIGIDTSEEIIDVAIEKSRGIENTEYRKCDEYEFPIDAQSVDYAFICNVIHEVKDKQKFMEEVKRVVKHEGYLCIIEWEKKPMNKGPRVEERISIEEIKEFASFTNMQAVEEIFINDEHYGAKLKSF